METLKITEKRDCVNGDGNLVCPSDDLLCQVCHDKEIAEMKKKLRELKERHRRLERDFLEGKRK